VTDPSPLERWQARVKRDLRGADFSRALVHEAVDGLRTQPLYTRADREGLDLSGPAGAFPWTRGRAEGGWQAWQSIAVPDPAQAAAQAVEELSHGAHGLHLVLDASGPGGRGLRLQGLAEVHALLAALPGPELILSLDPGPDFMALSSAFLLAAAQQGRSLRGCLGADPVGLLASTGRLDGGSRALAWVGDLASACAEQAPQLRAACADGSPWHEAGAGDGLELGLVLATGITLVRALEAESLDLPRAFSQISFRLRLSSELLQGVAKVRALRAAWGRVAQACGLGGHPAGRAFVHVLPGERGLSRRDPWINLLRNTAVGFAGAVGGADAVTTLPLDHALGAPDALGRRIARNTQTILAHESHLGRVADPAGGSFFLERRTAELVEAAWARMQEIEARGGVLPALVDGTVAGWVAGERDRRAERVARRRQPLTGLSEYADLDELPLAARAVARFAPAAPAPTVELPTLPEPDGGTLSAALQAALAGPDARVPLAVLSEALAVEPPALQAVALPRQRLAAPYETLRDRSDAILAATGTRPSVYLACLGSLAEHQARLGFATHLLAAGGLRALSGAGSAGLSDSGCRVAVLCGTDAAYADQGAKGGAACAAALLQAGATAVWLAGRPGAQEQALRAAGVGDWLYQGCDALAVLDAIWTQVQP